MNIEFEDIQIGDEVRVTINGKVTAERFPSDIKIVNGYYFDSDSNATYEKLSPSWPTEIGSVVTAQYMDTEPEQAFLTGNGWTWIGAGHSFAGHHTDRRYKIISVDRIGI